MFFWKNRDREVKNLIPTDLSGESNPLGFRDRVKRIYHCISVQNQLWVTLYSHAKMEA